MPYQISSDFQTILDFATMSHQKELMEQELEASIAMAQFKADAAKVAAANSNSLDVAKTMMGLRKQMAKLDVSNEIDKAIYDNLKKRLDALL